MTAHREKPTLTPERVEWFARYYLQPGNGAWGLLFHACLEDGNWDAGAGCGSTRDSLPDDERDAAAWFDALTPSQRRRLGRKAERRAAEIRRGA